jgi:hypothetical protein
MQSEKRKQIDIIYIDKWRYEVHEQEEFRYGIPTYTPARFEHCLILESQSIY